MANALNENALNEREQKILAAIWLRWKAGRRTTLQEMSEAAGYRGSPGSVTAPVLRLVNDGFITSLPLRTQGRLDHKERRGMHAYTRGPRLAGVDRQGRVGRVIDETRGWL